MDKVYLKVLDNATSFKIQIFEKNNDILNFKDEVTFQKDISTNDLVKKINNILLSLGKGKAKWTSTTPYTLVYVKS